MNNKDIAAVASPDMSYLSESDVEMLDKYIDQLKDKGFSEVSDASHGYAWSHTAQNGVISVRDRLTEMGDSDEYINYIEEQMRKDGTTSVICKMKEEHVTDVLKIVRTSKVISERHKKMFFY